MKKTGLGFLLLMSAALLGAQTGQIQRITGKVEVKTPGAVEWRAAEAGQVLDKASLISTGFRSNALTNKGSGASLYVYSGKTYWGDGTTSIGTSNGTLRGGTPTGTIE